MSRILITGGTGFIGSFLAEKLVKKGNEVIILDNNFRGKEKNIETIKDSIHIFLGDIRNRKDVDKAIKNIDIVYHLAAINGTKYFYEIPEKVLEVNVKGLINVLEASIANKVKRFIFSSSSEVYNQPDTIPTPETERILIPDIKNPRFSYAGSKIIGELFCLNYGRKSETETIIVRYHNIYGPRMGFEHVMPEFILRMKKLSENFKKKNIVFPIHSSGEETRAFCFVEDAVRGTIIVAEKGEKNEIYNIGNDKEEIKVKDLTKLMGKILELEIDIDIKSNKFKVGGTSRRCPDITKIRRIGYEPEVDLKTGLKKTINWYLDRLKT
jgi:nucleoside-diphosphate-sugar epimerase